MVTIDDIPVYDAVIDEDGLGMTRISLVDDPAVMSDFVAFKDEKKRLLYAIEDEEERKVLGVVMRADFPIYRIDKERGEYYIIYRADVIKQMAEKYLLESRQNDVNLDHDEDKVVDGVQMVQCFIKDSARGVSPVGFDDIADGSLFAEFHVVNDDVWQAIKDGTYKGFSLEGWFTLEPEEDAEDVQNIVDTLKGQFRKLFKSSKDMGKAKDIFKAIMSAIIEVSMKETTTDKGVIAWDGDDDLKAGDAVYQLDDNGERVAAADGDYRTEDGKIIRVADGKVTEIVDDEAEVAGGRITTDNGELVWDGEADLKAGDAVYVEDEEGNRTPAPDGDYKTEDGKTIKVAEGKVTEIVDPDAEANEEGEADVKAARKERFTRVKALMSESYDDKTRKISEALEIAGFHGWVCEAGDDFAVVGVWDELTCTNKYYKFSISWNGDDVVVGDYTEVKYGFIPVDEPAEPAAPAAENAPTAEEMSALQERVHALIAENERLRKQPLAKPMHESFEATVESRKTGNKSLDRLAEMMSKTR